MKRKLAAIVLAIAALIGINASPAFAVQNNSVGCWNYAYYSSVDFNRPGNGNVVFNWWTITAGPNGLPMEYRVRWFAPNGTTVIYDTGYVASTSINPGANVGVAAYLPGYTSTVLVNAGKAGDGHATCEMWFNIPGA